MPSILLSIFQLLDMFGVDYANYRLVWDFNFSPTSTVLTTIIEIFWIIAMLIGMVGQWLIGTLGSDGLLVGNGIKLGTELFDTINKYVPIIYIIAFLLIILIIRVMFFNKTDINNTAKSDYMFGIQGSDVIKTFTDTTTMKQKFNNIVAGFGLSVIVLIILKYPMWILEKFIGLTEEFARSMSGVGGEGAIGGENSLMVSTWLVNFNDTLNSAEMESWVGVMNKTVPVDSFKAMVSPGIHDVMAHPGGMLVINAFVMILFCAALLYFNYTIFAKASFYFLGAVWYSIMFPYMLLKNIVKPTEVKKIYETVREQFLRLLTCCVYFLILIFIADVVPVFLLHLGTVMGGDSGAGAIIGLGMTALASFLIARYVIPEIKPGGNVLGLPILGNSLPAYSWSSWKDNLVANPGEFLMPNSKRLRYTLEDISDDIERKVFKKDVPERPNRGNDNTERANMNAKKVANATHAEAPGSKDDGSKNVSNQQRANTQGKPNGKPAQAAQNKPAAENKTSPENSQPAKGENEQVTATAQATPENKKTKTVDDNIDLTQVDIATPIAKSIIKARLAAEGVSQPLAELTKALTTLGIAAKVSSSAIGNLPVAEEGGKHAAVTTQQSSESKSDSGKTKQEQVSNLTPQTTDAIINNKGNSNTTTELKQDNDGKTREYFVNEYSERLEESKKRFTLNENAMSLKNVDKARIVEIKPIGGKSRDELFKDDSVPAYEYGQVHELTLGALPQKSTGRIPKPKMPMPATPLISQINDEANRNEVAALNMDRKANGVNDFMIPHTPDTQLINLNRDGLSFGNKGGFGDNIF